MASEIYRAKISGMHCAACSTRIEKVVGQLEGVTQCSVNLATEQAKIDYNPVAVSIAAINEAIGDLGFSAESITETSDEHTFRRGGCNTVGGDAKAPGAYLRFGKQHLVVIDGPYAWHTAA